MSLDQLRPRTATELIDGSFHLLKNHYSQFLLISAVVYVPAIILNVYMGVQGMTLNPTADVSGWVFFGVMVLLLCQIIGFAAIVVLVRSIYLDGKGEAGGALRLVMQRLGAVVLAAILHGMALLGVAILAGILVSISVFIPVLFVVTIPLAVVGFAVVFAWTFATQATLMIESLGPLSALRRSRQLASGSVPRIILMLAGVYIIYLLVATGTGALVLVLAQMGGSPALVAAAQVVNVAVQAAVFPVIGIVATLLYYDLRIRKEGFDLEHMAGELGLKLDEPAGMRSSPA